MVSACLSPPPYYRDMNVSSAPQESPLKTRVIQVEAQSRAGSITKIALTYLAYFLITAGVVGALVFAHQAIIPIICVAAFFALVPTVSLSCRAISYCRTRNIRSEVVDAQLKHLNEAFKCALGDRAFKLAQDEDRIADDMDIGTIKKAVFKTGKVTERNSEWFSKKVIQLRDEVRALTMDKRNVSLNSVEQAYSKFQALAENERFRDIYKEMKNEDLECMDFLKILAMKFRTAFVGKVMGSYAQRELPSTRGGTTPSEIGDVVLRHQDSGFNFKRSKPHQWIPWILAYPDRCSSAAVSNDAPKFYDSMADNNAVCFMKAECHGVPISLVAQPTLATDPVFDLIGADASNQIIVNLLDACKSHEYPWIEQLEKRTKGSKSDHLVFGFTSKKKSDLMNCPKTWELLNSYKASIKREGRSISSKGMGTYISSNDLSDEEINASFKQISELLKENLSLSKKKKQAVLALADAMLAFKKILKKAEGMKGSIDADVDETMRGLTVSVGCKQCQDRGPIILMALMLLMRAHKSEKPLSQEEFYQIASVVLRAPVNEGRIQLQEKAEVTKELFQLFGTDMASIHQIAKNL